MKNICYFLCFIVGIIAFCELFEYKTFDNCYGSDAAQIEELSDDEKNFVGTWVLEDITYFEFGKVQLWYPSDSNTFNTLCEQYLGRTIIILDSTKKDGKISGDFFAGSTKISFNWVCQAPKIIKFSNSLSLSFYNGNTISEMRTNTAMIDTRGKLCINLSNHMIYIFRKSYN